MPASSAVSSDGTIDVYELKAHLFDGSRCVHRHGLDSGLRRGRITTEQLREFEDDVRILDIRTDVVQPGLTRLVNEAPASSLTAYDVSYLLLARDRGLALATIDHQLAAAARQQGVPVLGS